MLTRRHITADFIDGEQIHITARERRAAFVTHAKDVRPEGAQPLARAVFQRPKRFGCVRST